SDPFVDVRREAVFALGDARKTDMSATLITAYGDRESRVRSAAMASMKNAHGGNLVPTLLHAFEQDSSYTVAAAAVAARGRGDSVNALKYCSAGLARNSYRESIRIAALRALGNLATDSAFAMIRKATAYGNDRGVRMEGLWIMSRTWKSREET